MKKGYKSLLSAVLAVIMIFAACVPAFAASESTSRAKKNEGIAITMTKRANAFHQKGEKIEVAATVTNTSNEAKDIEVKVVATAFAPILTIDGKVNPSHKVLFKNVKPGESKTVTAKVLADRVELPIYSLDGAYALALGKITSMLCEVYDIFAANTVMTTFGYSASMASVIFIANDVTPEIETETTPVVA